MIKFSWYPSTSTTTIILEKRSYKNSGVQNGVRALFVASDMCYPEERELITRGPN